MRIVIICTLIAFFIFSSFVILYGEDHSKKIQNNRDQILKILDKVQELQDRLDLHKF